MVRYLIAMVLLFTGVGSLLAQTTGSLQGVVKDANTGETVPMAAVILYQDGVLVTGTEADYDGNYNFSNISAGTYDIEISYVGLQSTRITGVPVRVGRIEIVDLEFPEVKLDPDDPNSKTILTTVVVIEHKIKLVDQSQMGGGQTLGAEDVDRMTTRGIDAVQATTAGVNQADEGEPISSNGSRPSSNDIYVDGVRVLGGSFGIPETEIEQIQVITSGIPAEYGDATGAITNIITKGPSNEFTGGIQMETSQFLDGFAASRVDLGFAGPIISQPLVIDGDTIMKADSTVKRKTILGFRLAGLYSTNLDSDPSALGWYKLKDDVKDQILANPLVLSDAGNIVFASDTLTEASIERVKVRPNGRNHTAMGNLKLDFKPSDDFYVVAGGQIQQRYGFSQGTTDILFNTDFNPRFQQTIWRAYGRFRHTVSSTTIEKSDDEEQDSVVKLQPVFQNFSYELQGDYSQINFSREDPRYGDNLFNYGYIGKFYRSLAPTLGTIDTNVIVNSVGDTLGEVPVFGHAAYNIQFNGYEADPNINPGLAAYNNLIDPADITNIDQFEIVNGRFVTNRESVFGLFTSPHNNGSTTTLGESFAKSNQNQIRGTIRANFDLVSNQQKSLIRHSISLGGVYEQRISRSYSIAPTNLWTLADQSANSHLSLVTDLERPNGGEFYNPFTERYYETYDPLIRQEEDGSLVEMTQFGDRVRESLGKTQYDWINV
ncbi:MAG: TonB-dependent receptor, partial [Saprospiraceae bacterium]|nr:TonB-dependent receptor [Saprospiraceae bacterium]